MKTLSAAVALACLPGFVSAKNVPCPTENVAAFVVERLDVTTLPEAIRPKRLKGKKTLAEYGFVPSHLEEREAQLTAAQGDLQISITILDQNSAAIFACVQVHGTGANGDFQRAIRIAGKNAGSLLKSRESFRDFAGCPDVGGLDNGADPYGG